MIASNVEAQTFRKHKGSEYWASSKRKPGVGKVTVRTKGWTNNVHCMTYPTRTIQHKAYIRRMKLGYIPYRRR